MLARAKRLNYILKQLGQGKIDWDRLVNARTEAEVEASFCEYFIELRELLPTEKDDVERTLKPRGRKVRKVPRQRTLLLGILKDRKFPRTNRDAQIRFIAESMAGSGQVSPRRCRDICGEERKRPKYRITRQEPYLYIECTCGYQGPALYNICPECETQSKFPAAVFL